MPKAFHVHGKSLDADLRRHDEVAPPRVHFFIISRFCFNKFLLMGRRNNSNAPAFQPEGIEILRLGVAGPSVKSQRAARHGHPPAVTSSA
ncbi:hypothetical protein [Rhodopila sp.]|uniref:hypothetical protein n=1 Tax=Rhodopila sp. TaxID=2480087 RepID=UPI003D0EAB44